MLTKVVLSGSEFKQLLMGRSVYKDIRTGPLEIVLNNDVVEEVSVDQKHLIGKPASKFHNSLLTGDDD